MEDAGQFDQQVNGAAALTVLHTADMLLACQSQANRQLLLRNATGSANIVKSLEVYLLCCLFDCQCTDEGGKLVLLINTDKKKQKTGASNEILSKIFYKLL